MTDHEISEFFTHARNHCCNFQRDRGPNGKISYCWLEPRETGSICLIKTGLYCNWFEVVVLPINKNLQRQWRDIQKRVKPVPGLTLKCECGMIFKPTGRRQRVCLECGKVKTQERIAGYRAKKV